MMKTRLHINAWLLMLILTSIAAVPRPSEDGRAFLSTDRGVTWQRADHGLPEGEGINTVILHNGHVFAGTDRHGVWTLDQNGWSAQSKGLPKESRVLTLFSYNRILYAGLHNKGLYYSIDDGYTWRMSGRDATANVRAIGEFRGAIYAGTDDGIFRIVIKNDNWELLLGGYQINALASNESYIYGGTHLGVVRSGDGFNWEQVYSGTAINRISLNNSGVSIIDYSDNVYRGLMEPPTFIRENIYLPHTLYFRLTPTSRKLMADEWSDVSFLRSTNGSGLPVGPAFNILIRTRFGLLTASSRSGC